MFLPKPFKKLIAVLRGDVAPVLILLSTMLGFWFGLTPGWYGLHVALLVVALVVNIHFGIFVLFAGFGKTLSFAAAPLLFHTGVWAHEHASALFAAVAATPVVAMTDTSRFAVAGALLIGPVVGLLAGALLAMAVGKFRRTWLRLEENSEAFRTWRQKGWIKLLDRLLVGKSATDVRAVLKRRPRIVRLAGVALAAIVVVLSVGGLYFVDDDVVRAYAAESLTAANGAQVDLQEVTLALAGGRVSVTGIEITDPQRPTHNRAAVGVLTADVSLWQLLFGRLVMDQIELSDVRLDQVRKSPGVVTSAAAATTASKAAAFDPIQFNIAETDIAALRTYVKNTQQLGDWLQSVQGWLPSEQDEAEAAETPIPETYLAHLTARAATPPTPRVVIRELVLADVEIPIDEIGVAKIVCRNLSDAPRGAGRATTIEVTSNKRSSSVKITLHYESPASGAEIAATFEDIDLRTLQTRLSPSNPVVFESGTATATVTGSATPQRIDLAIKIKTKGMRAAATSVAMFGLDPQITNEAMKVLENIETTLRVVGPLAEPRLVFDSLAMRREIRTALVKAGKAELVKRLDALVGDSLPGGLAKPSQLVSDSKAVLKDVAGNLGDPKAALKGLLSKNADGKNADGKHADGQKNKPNVKNILGGLLGDKNKDAKKADDPSKKNNPLEALRKKLKKP